MSPDSATACTPRRGGYRARAHTAKSAARTPYHAAKRRAHRYGCAPRTKVTLGTIAAPKTHTMTHEAKPAPPAQEISRTT